MEPSELRWLITMISVALLVADQLLLIYLYPRLANLFSRRCTLSETDLRRTFAVTAVYLVIIAVWFFLSAAEMFL